MKKGQINRGSNLGEEIFNLSRRNNVKTIVEIGTWNGMGSTKCIYDAVKETDKVVYSLECNKDRHKEAIKNLGSLGRRPVNFNLLYGSIVNVDELTPILDNLKNETFRDWLKADIDWVKKAPNVFNKLPGKIDLCVIDGGEFSGYLEFMKLWERCQYIVLDDAKTNKHRKTRGFILNNTDKFIIIADNLNERNGYLICEVINGVTLSNNKLLQELNKLIEHKKCDNDFIIDIGASYNSYFLECDCNGVLFDMDAKKVKDILKGNLYKKVVRKITPDNIVNSLQEYKTPHNFLALNLDIDSYDLFVLINILEQYSPEIIVTEINEKIPPPVKFSVKYHEDWCWKGDHFYGYSISCLEEVLKRFNYHIYKLVYNNVILVKGRSKIDIAECYNTGYLEAEGREKAFPWNANIEYWQWLKPEELEKGIEKYFGKYKGKYVIGKECNDLIKIHL